MVAFKGLPVCFASQLICKLQSVLSEKDPKTTLRGKGIVVKDRVILATVAVTLV